MVSGLEIGSSSRLSATVKSDKAVMVIDGDVGAEDFGLLSEGISGAGKGEVGGWGCSPMSGSPRDVATGVAAGSRDLETVALGFALRRIGGAGWPSQQLSRSFKISYNPQNSYFFLHRQDQRPHLCESSGNRFTSKIARFEEVAATIHNRWVHIGRKGGTGYFEEDHQRIQLVSVDSGLEGEGLENAIPDVFQLHAPEIDPVSDKVHPGVKFAELLRLNLGESSTRYETQALSEELLKRLATQSIMQADSVGR